MLVWLQQLLVWRLWSANDELFRMTVTVIFDCTALYRTAFKPNFRATEIRSF
jgi:hypothetical protein